MDIAYALLITNALLFVLNVSTAITSRSPMPVIAAFINVVAIWFILITED